MASGMGHIRFDAPFPHRPSASCRVCAHVARRYPEQLIGFLRLREPDTRPSHSLTSDGEPGLVKPVARCAFQCNSIYSPKIQILTRHHVTRSSPLAKSASPNEWVVRAQHLKTRRERSGDSLDIAAQKIGSIIGRRINKSTIHRIESGAIDAAPFVAAYDTIYPRHDRTADGHSRLTHMNYATLVEAVRRGMQRWRERQQRSTSEAATPPRNLGEHEGRWSTSAQALHALCSETSGAVYVVLSAANPAILGSDAASRRVVETALGSALPLNSTRATAPYEREIFHLQRIAPHPDFESNTWATLLTGLEWSMCFAQRNDFRSPYEMNDGSDARDLTRQFGYRFLTIASDVRPITFPTDIFHADDKAVFCVSERSDGICDTPLAVTDAGKLRTALERLRSQAETTILVFPPTSRAMSAFVDAFRSDIDERFLVDRPFFSSFTRPEHHRRPGTAWWERLEGKWRRSLPDATPGVIHAEIQRHAENEADVFRRWQIAMREKGGRYAQVACKQTIECWARTGSRPDRGEGLDSSVDDARSDDSKVALEGLEYVDRIITLIKDSNGAFQLALSDDAPDREAIGIAVQGGHHIGWEILCGAEYEHTMSGYIRNSMMARVAAEAIESKISKLPDRNRSPRSVIDYLETKIRQPLIARAKS